VVGEGQEDIDDGNFYCFACWLIYHASRARLWRDTEHVQPARNLQGVAYAPGSAQHARSIEHVSLTLGRRPQLQWPGVCTEHQRACTQITTQAVLAHGREAEFTQVGGWDTSSDSDASHIAVEESDRGDSAVEGSDEGNSDVKGSEEYFDESEHVDGFAAEERSTDGEEVDESEGEDGRGPEGSDFAAEEGYEEDGSCPEGSDFAAEEGYKEGGPDAEEGYEEVWDEVQEALSTMGQEEYDETAEADFCARSQASRPSPCFVRDV
jgi:hypothetical protein